MNKASTAFAVAALAAIIAAVLLGVTAGNFYNAGINPAGTKAFALAILTSFIAGGFALAALRLRHRTPKPPGTPIENRKWCRTEW